MPTSIPPSSPLATLQSAVTISSCRDRSKLLGVFLQAVSALLGENTNFGVFVRDLHGYTLLHFFSGPSGVKQWYNDREKIWCASLATAYANTGELSCTTIEQNNHLLLRLYSSELSANQLILAIEYGDNRALGCEQEVMSLAQMYNNQLTLLDYAELDTLTRLLNRKTFDETFERLLVSSSHKDEEALGFERRNPLPEETQAWLCVIDIDFFKRVNDVYGHLFGDEVLLRTGALIRKIFRDGDRLFRFGGEEFVVILNAAHMALAKAGFDRFRLAVEQYDFPRIGQITCSIGFTAFYPNDVPTDVIGRADEALYYAKRHGRNQVCYYEDLVEAGEITPPEMTQSAVADDVDIDALFNA